MLIKYKRNLFVEKFIQGICSNLVGEKKMILDIKVIIEYIEKIQI